MKISIKENFQNYQNNIDIDKIESNYNSIKNGLIIVINILLVSFFILIGVVIIYGLIPILRKNVNDHFKNKFKILYFLIIILLSFIVPYIIFYNKLINKLFQFIFIKYKNIDYIKNLGNETNINLVEIIVISSILIMLIFILFSYILWLKYMNPKK